MYQLDFSQYFFWFKTLLRSYSFIHNLPNWTAFERAILLTAREISMKSPKHQLLTQSVNGKARQRMALVQNKIDDDDIDSRERAVVKHWLIQSLAGGSFTSLYPVRQTARGAESEFVGFTSCILPICICICLFGLDWLDLPEHQYPFCKNPL